MTTDYVVRILYLLVKSMYLAPEARNQWYVIKELKDLFSRVFLFEFMA